VLIANVATYSGDPATIPNLTYSATSISSVLVQATTTIASTNTAVVTSYIVTNAPITPTIRPDSLETKNISSGAIAGIAIAVILVMTGMTGIIAVATFIVLRRARNKRHEQTREEEATRTGDVYIEAKDNIRSELLGDIRHPSELYERPNEVVEIADSRDQGIVEVA